MRLQSLMIQVSNCGACLPGARGALPQGSTCQGEHDDDVDDGGECDDNHDDDDYSDD